MVDKEEMICPNCGSKKFIFMDSTTCKCDYCNSEWKLTDILGMKKLELDAKVKDAADRRKTEAGIKLLTNETFVGLVLTALIIIGGLLFFGIAISNSMK